MSETQLGAVIWDMDGVIADTGPYHFMAWQDVFGKRGVNFTEADFQHNFGKRNDTIVRYAFSGNISSEEADVITTEKEKSFRRRVAKNVKPLPGAVQLIKVLEEKGVKMAIASSAPPENIRLVAGRLGIYQCFDAIVWGREVTEGKPSPQVYLLAARKLGVDPQNCIVIEDALAGVIGAKKAGMKCLAVTNTHSRDSLHEADLVVDTLESVDFNDLRVLFAVKSGKTVS